MGESRNLRIWLTFLALAATVLLCREDITAGIQRFFSDPEVVSFLLYLETGKAIHVSGQWEETAPPTLPAIPEETAEATQPTQGPAAMENSDSVYIRNSSGLPYDADALLHKQLVWDLTDGEPSVLIFHTHATESYTPTKENSYEASSYYRTLESEDNMLRVGQVLMEGLQQMGIEALHDTTLHDYPSYTGSYGNARKTLKRYLEGEPTLQLLLDIHRDAVESDSGKQLPTRITVDGRKIAQIMLVVGTDAGGLHNPLWQENLALALKLQHQLEAICPGICRYISLRPERFNQDLSPGMMLIEVGAAGNTLEEALGAAEILAQAIGSLAKGTTADSTS